jgi:hypothetical protein
MGSNITENYLQPLNRALSSVLAEKRKQGQHTYTEIVVMVVAAAAAVVVVAIVVVVVVVVVVIYVLWDSSQFKGRRQP